MDGRNDASIADLAAKLQSIARNCDLHAIAATDDLPAGFGQVDDVIVLLQPLRLTTTENYEGLLESTLRQLAEKNFLTGTQAVGGGGIATALVCGCGTARFGFHAELSESEGASAEEALFGERRCRALVSTRPKAHVPLANFVERGAQFTAEAIGRVTAGDVCVKWMGDTLFETPDFYGR